MNPDPPPPEVSRRELEERIEQLEAEGIRLRIKVVRLREIVEDAHSHGFIDAWLGEGDQDRSLEESWVRFRKAEMEGGG